MTVNGMSSEVLYLLNSAQGLCMPQGNTSHGVLGELCEETRSPRPIRATHYVSQATSEALRFLIDPKHTSLPSAFCRERDSRLELVYPEAQYGCLHGRNPRLAGGRQRGFK